MDANMLHISYEGNALEDPWAEAPADMWSRTVDPAAAPGEPEYIELEFEKGNPVALNGARLSPAVMLERLNEVAGKHGASRDSAAVTSSLLSRMQRSGTGWSGTPRPIRVQSPLRAVLCMHVDCMLCLPACAARH